MFNLRMILDAVKLFIFIFESRDRTGFRNRSDFEAVGNLFDIVGMAHPAHRTVADILEKLRSGILKIQRLLSVFADFGRVGDSAELLSHELSPVADPEDRNTEIVDRGIHLRRAFLMRTARAACKNDADRVDFPDPVDGDIVRNDLRIDPVFADAAGNQLIVLRAEIHDDDRFSFCHVSSVFSFFN